MEMSEVAQRRHKMVEQCLNRLSHIAYRSLHIKGLKPNEFVMTCIEVDSRWRWLVDQLMPDADWQEWRDRGAEPVALGSSTWRVCELLIEILPELKNQLLETPGEGRVKLVALDEGGATVYEIEPLPELLN